MKKQLIGLGVAALMFGGVSGAGATLIGDEVTAGHYFPSLASPPIAGIDSAIVTDGTDDLLHPVTMAYTVDVNSDSFYIDFIEGLGWNPNGTFNGLVLSSLNDSSGNVLQGVSMVTNVDGWDDNWVTFDADSVYVDMRYWNYDSDTFVEVSMDFAPVPEPATMLLFGTGLAGLVGSRISKKKQQ